MIYLSLLTSSPTGGLQNQPCIGAVGFTISAPWPAREYLNCLADDVAGAADELGRHVRARGRCLNGLGVFLNPNLYTVNCLTEWEFDGVTAFGEDHDNWSAAGIRRFLGRSRAGRKD